MPGRAPSQGESHCVSCPRALFPAASSLLSLLPAQRPLVAALQAHTSPGTLPVTPSWPPYPRSLEGRGIKGPTQNWLLLTLVHRILECPNWKGFGSVASPAPLCTDGNQAPKSETSFGQSDVLGSPSLDPGTLGPQSSIQLLLQTVTE